MKISHIVSAAAAAVMFAVVGSAHAYTVDLAANAYNPADVTTYTGFQSLSLGAGTYNISVVSGTYNGWTYTTPTAGYREAFDISLDGGKTFTSYDVSQPFTKYATTAAALSAFAAGPYDTFSGTTDKTLIASGLSSMQFTLNSATTVIFGIPDNKFDDNTGGVSLSVTAAVPEPETYALMLAGLGALGFMARRRSDRA